MILLGQVTKERVTLVANLCRAKERGRTLEVQLEVLKVKDDKLRCEKDKIASELGTLRFIPSLFNTALFLES